MRQPRTPGREPSQVLADGELAGFEFVTAAAALENGRLVE